MTRSLCATKCWLVSAILLLAACGGGTDLRDAIPAPDVIAGWFAAGEPQVFEVENLYDLVDGQADAFFAYGFEQVAVGIYEDRTGNLLRVEVWQVATAADAYGLFSSYRGGEPASVGNEGDSDPGRRLDFWQNRYFVRVSTLVPAEHDTLQALAGLVSERLPGGGDRPSLLGRLPQEGLMAGSDLFFHQEISVQDRLWLGGQNLLGLDSETDAVLARYELAGEGVWLLLVHYPDAVAASTALEALRAGEIDSFAAAELDDTLLAAVFGPAGEGQAEALLSKVLETQ